MALRNIRKYGDDVLRKKCREVEEIDKRTLTLIKDMFESGDSIDIQRNELAEKFNCVPSQINYVISTRFKPNQGYYVESQRG